MLDMTAFAKARLDGPGAERFLDYFVANKLPRAIGRVGLCHSLSPGGGVHSASAVIDMDELSVDAEESFGLSGVLVFGRHDNGWLAGASQLVLDADNGTGPESELRIDAS